MSVGFILIIQGHFTGTELACSGILVKTFSILRVSTTLLDSSPFNGSLCVFGISSQCRSLFDYISCWEGGGRGKPSWSSTLNHSEIRPLHCIIYSIWIYAQVCVYICRGYEISCFYQLVHAMCSPKNVKVISLPMYIHVNTYSNRLKHTIESEFWSQCGFSFIPCYTFLFSWSDNGYRHCITSFYYVVNCD